MSSESVLVQALAQLVIVEVVKVGRRIHVHLSPEAYDIATTTLALIWTGEEKIQT